MANITTTKTIDCTTINYNVLIVDDSAVMRRMIRRSLSTCGVSIGEVHEASDGEQALKFLEKTWIDLILTDMNMPHMSGSAMLEVLRADTQLSNIPCVVVTSDKSPSLIEKARELGVKGYLLKPFKPNDLRTMVEKALQPETQEQNND